MQRRKFLRNAGAAGAALLAGCGAAPTSDDNTLQVATYPAFVDAPSSSPGAWLKEEFDSRHGATLEWVPLDGELNHFIQRRQQGVGIDADVYTGVRQMDLVRIEQQLDDPLFRETDPAGLANGDTIKEEYRFDSENRAIPFDGSYVSLVYDENVIDPATYEDLVGEESLLLPSPVTATTGRMFLLMTIHEFGPDGYLDYWSRLSDSLTVTGDWSAAYAAYENEEAPMITSYSTDQVYASQGDSPMSRHQVGFPNGQGYAYIAGSARFDGTDKPELGKRYLEFLLEPDVQAEIAQRNVAIPATTNAELSEDYTQYVYEPETTVRFSKERLAENLGTWTTEWSEQFASN